MDQSHQDLQFLPSSLSILNIIQFEQDFLKLCIPLDILDALLYGKNSFFQF